MYYSYVEIEYVATSFSPTRTDLALKLLREKYFYWHWLCLYISWLAKKPFSGKSCLVCLSALYLLILHNFEFHLLGERASMHPREANWTQKAVVAMPMQDLKKYCMCPHVLTLDNIGDPVLNVCTWLWKTCRLLTISLLGCVVVHCSLRVESSLL